jgi:peroxiredoxin
MAPPVAQSVAPGRGLKVVLGTAAVGVVLATGFYFATHRGPVVAPDFAVADLQGRTVRLSALRGKVVVLNLWTTWCPPCIQEMPSMERLYHAFDGEDLTLLAVSQDEDGRHAVEPFVEKMRFSFPIFLDPEHQVGDRYEVTGYPETFVIDRNGLVVEHVIGPRDWASPESVAALRTLLAARGDAAAASAPHGPS